MNLSPDVRHNIIQLLVNHRHPGYFRNHFHTDSDTQLKCGGFGKIYKALPLDRNAPENSDIAVKEIQLKDNQLVQSSLGSNSMSTDITHQFLAACQEAVLHLSLANPHIVKCHQSWIEPDDQQHSSRATCKYIWEDLLAIVNSPNGEHPIDRIEKAAQAADGLKIYIVMDYYDCNLQELLELGLRINYNLKDELIDIMLDISDAISYMHYLRYIHRDIKPENIVLKVTDGKIFAALGNFGLCRRGEDCPPQQCGTLFFYDYPEYQAHTASDMAAFGLTMLETFAKLRTIRSGRDMLLRRHDIVSKLMLKLRANCSPYSVKKDIGIAIGGAKSYRKVKTVIWRCVQMNPSDRPNAADIRQMMGRSSEVSTVVH